jgi:hypothetical protein
MDKKRFIEKSKEKDKNERKYSNNYKNSPLLQKDIIYCKNTLQNNNTNINKNISKRINKNISSNRVRSAHYTINSRKFSEIKNKNKDKELDKKSKELKKIYLSNNYNNNLYNATNYNSKDKSLRAYLSSINRKTHSNIKINSAKKNKNKLNKISLKNINKNKKYVKNNGLIEKIIENKYESKVSFFEDDLEIMKEYDELKTLWHELGITNNFIQNFEYMNNNKNNNREDVLQLIKTEKKQMTQFKNEFMKVLKEIEKREDEIKNIKQLDQKYSNFHIYYNFENESDVKNNLNNKNIICKEDLEKSIHKCLSTLRLKGINTVSQI